MQIVRFSVSFTLFDQSTDLKVLNTGKMVISGLRSYSPIPPPIGLCMVYMA